MAVRAQGVGERARHAARRRVCVVGSGTRFLSGISYYTNRLAQALNGRSVVSVILMRRLLPRRFYPGRDRVAADLSEIDYPSHIQVLDGVDWFWGLSMPRALLFLSRQQPTHVVFQWWTGTVLHSYLLLAAVARLRGARIIVEFHEVLDTGEAAMPVVGRYVGLVARWMLRMADGFVIHSEYDRSALEQAYAIEERPVKVIHHGPYAHHSEGGVQPHRPPDESARNILFFGTIRPYKGLEDLVQAFGDLPADVGDRYWLTVVGETWEGWTLPAELIAASPRRGRITFVNRYVTDAEAAGYLAGADVVALPYHRSSASGPLHMAMAHGLPVVVTKVGGLEEAVAGYQGALTVPPRDPKALGAALTDVGRLAGSVFADPHSWETSAEAFAALFDSIDEA